MSLMRKHFDKSLDVDEAARADNVKMILAHNESYSIDENGILRAGGVQFNLFDDMKHASLELAFPLTAAKIAHHSGSGKVWGGATTTVRTSPKHVFVWIWNTNSRAKAGGRDLVKETDERPNLRIRGLADLAAHQVQQGGRETLPQRDSGK